MPGKKTNKVNFLLVGQSQQTFENDISLLKKAGYQNIVFTDTVSDARKILIESQVDFVICELEMTLMNGIEFLKLLRRHPFWMVIPFLLVSNNKQMEMVKYALDEQADGYLLAPYSGEELLCAIIRIQLKLSSLSNQQIILRNAKHLFLNRNYDKALEMIHKIVKVEPENLDALLILSECLYRKRNIDQARKFINRILKKAPHNYKALHLLSKICSFDADCGDAFTHLTSALRQNPLNEDLKIDLGKFYLDTGMDEKADEIFNEILNANPTDLNLVKIGKALLKKNRLNDASKFLDKTTKPLPETAYIFKLYADMLKKDGNPDASLEQLQKCVSIAPANTKNVLSLAEELQHSAHNAEAQDLLRKFLEKEPENEEVKAMLASF